MTDYLREAYARGQITLEQFEYFVQMRILREQRDQPLPDGWQPLPPCEHEWVDITTFGQPLREQLCPKCGERHLYESVVLDPDDVELPGAVMPFVQVDCPVVIPGVGKCELLEHELDGRDRQVHRRGACSWNGA